MSLCGLVRSHFDRVYRESDANVKCFLKKKGSTGHFKRDFHLPGSPSFVCLSEPIAISRSTLGSLAIFQGGHGESDGKG